jgi:LuxR family maltose regulon positive regulatory protein
MARATPAVQQGRLRLPNATISIGEPEWFAWLTEHRVFRFISATSSYTARREQRAAGWYWYAYRRQRGLLNSIYLGKSEHLTPERLSAVADQLAAPALPDKPRAGLVEQRFLLTTKLAAPAIHATLLPRPRLTSYLRSRANRKLLLISGPAGSGKTTLALEWIKHLACPVAWFSLDQGDNDPARFWSYVLAALQQPFPGLASQLLPVAQEGTGEPFLILLINALAALPDQIVLVLDNYHVLTEPQVHNGVAFLLEHAPRQLRLILLSRHSQPPLPLPRLRAHGELAEVNFDALRFTQTEAEQLFTSLTRQHPEQLASWLAYTEGWATGLYLMAQAASQGHLPRSPQLAEQGNRAIFEYLASEVFTHLPEPVQTFLVQCSVLERFTSDLCAAVTLQKQSPQLLAYLERANLFLSPLDEQQHWFRYHDLFADFLRTQLEQMYPGQASILHDRAANWYAQQALFTEAITHALQAENLHLAARLIEEQGRQILLSREIVLLRSWLSALPVAFLYEHPRLCVYAAWTQLHTASNLSIATYLSAAEQQLECLDEAERQALYGEIVAIRARTAIYQDRIEESIALSHQALACLEPDDDYLRGEVAFSLGTTSEVLGRTQVAEAAYQQAIMLGLRCGNLRSALMATRSLALLYTNQGKLRQAMKLYQESLEHARQAGQEHLPPLGFMYLGLGEISYSRNQLELAERHFRQGIALGQRGGDVKIWLIGYVRLIRIAQDRGEYQQAWDLYAEAERLTRQANFLRGMSWLEEEYQRLSQLSQMNSLVEALSEREIEILNLLATGLSNQAIAEKLIIGLNTVKTHLKNIYGKLGAHNRTQAIAHARFRQLLQESAQPSANPPFR